MNTSMICVITSKTVLYPIYVEWSDTIRVYFLSFSELPSLYIYGICDIREAWNMNCARNVWHRMVLLTPMYRSTQMSFRCRFRFHREDHFFVKICWISISQSIVPLINSAKNKDSDLKINLRELWICTRPFASFSLIKKRKILLRIQES